MASQELAVAKVQAYPSHKVYGGDPRRPNEAHPYRAPKVKEEDASPDYMALLSLVFGMFGLLLKIKSAPWVSLLMVLCAVANRNFITSDTKQFVSAFVFGIMGLVSLYLQPQLVKKPDAPA